MIKIEKFNEFNEVKNTKIVSAFPGCGKSYLFKNEPCKKILDSDSSNFSWISKGVRNPDFPNNYINHIKENIGKSDIILVSSHKNVRDALVENNIPFIIVYPEKSLKEEYIKRFKERGNDEGFVKLLETNWNNFIDELEKQKGCKHIVLKSGQYLSDVI